MKGKPNNIGWGDKISITMITLTGILAVSMFILYLNGYLTT